jgi:hypothetical protein
MDEISSQWRASYYRAITDTVPTRSTLIAADNEEDALEKAAAEMEVAYRVDLVRTFRKVEAQTRRLT